MRTNLEARLLTVNTGPLLAGYMHRPGQQIWIDEHAAKFIDAAANTPHRGMTSTSVLEGIHMLFRYTGDPRYLEFCRYIVRS